jgi:CheY-like chemotaxis protein
MLGLFQPIFNTGPLFRESVGRLLREFGLSAASLMSTILQRISYVEDEPDIRSITEFALTQIGGFTLDICNSGLEAIEKAPAFKPDLILLDVMMPGMDGIETFQRLKDFPDLANTPIVFMTAKAMRHEVSHYVSLGAADVIATPFNPISLPDRIREIWMRVQQ